MRHGSAALAVVALLAAGSGFGAGWAARGRPEAAVAALPPLPPPSLAPAKHVEEEQPAPAAPTQAAAEPPRAQPRVVHEKPPEPEPIPAPRKSQEELLASVGFSSGAAGDLRQRSERFVQAREYLDEETEREEAAASLELARLQKKEIGDEAYSYMLWSAGIPNRVLVRGVVPDSNASQLGIQRGDVVLSYDGERVFEMEELRFLVREPSERARAEVEVLRNGEVVKLSAPRGILGIAVGRSFDPPREDLLPRRQGLDVQVEPPDAPEE